MKREEAIYKRDIIVTQIINELGVTIETNTKPLIRCKDCKWYDNKYGDVCHNPRYGDGHANYSPPYVDEEYWCKDGERREP